MFNSTGKCHINRRNVQAPPDLEKCQDKQSAKLADPIELVCFPSSMNIPRPLMCFSSPDSHHEVAMRTTVQSVLSIFRITKFHSTNKTKNQVGRQKGPKHPCSLYADQNM
jgi:hypothetical protein